MRQIFRRYEELAFTAVAYTLLTVVVLCFLTVRLTKEGYAKRLHEPRLLSVYPSAIVPGAGQTVTVISEKTHFGPKTTIRSLMQTVTISNVRFLSDGHISCQVYVPDFPQQRAGNTIPLAIQSSVEGAPEDLSLRLTVAGTAEPIELDLFNLKGQDQITVEQDFILLGYHPRGYAPFVFTARDLETGEIRRQETRNEIEHIGLALKSTDTPFELCLADALGREVTKHVLVTWQRDEESRSLLARLGFLNTCYATCTTYTGKPVQWGSDPTEQVAASDCVLSNASPLR